MKALGILIVIGIVAGLIYLQSTHEEGLGGVWNEITNHDAPGVNKIEQEYELDISP